MRFLLFLLLLPLPSFAQDGLVDPSDVMSVITADWNDDGDQDRAVLVYDRSEGMADLYIYLGERFDMIEHSFTKDAAWSGGMWGQQPYLELNEAGSLLVHSMNESIGRNRWHLTLTIAYRNERFVVAGFTYDDYDTLDLDAYSNCDINLLTGRGFVTQGKGKTVAVTVEQGPYYASEWNSGYFPDECL